MPSDITCYIHKYVNQNANKRQSWVTKFQLSGTNFLMQCKTDSAFVLSCNQQEFRKTEVNRKLKTGGYYYLINPINKLINKLVYKFL